ncbi:MAG: protein kinase [Candidatus Delongbacteria bacterium]
MIKKGDLIDSSYRVEDILGSGAQGVIYHVKTQSSEQDLALKLIDISTKDMSGFNEILDSVKSEFSIIRSLHHKNIISVYDFGYDKISGKYYYTMDFLKGCDLSTFVSGGQSSIKFPGIVYQILDGLNYLHSNNIIHFDIKPENIYITEETKNPTVKILDFGLSEIKKHNKQNNIARGTLSYIAPEFFLDPTRIGPKIDLYSLGITLIHVNKKITGSNTGSAGKGSLISAINKEHNRNMELLSTFKEKKIRSFISQLTEKNPGTRISSAIEAIISLNRIFNLDYQVPRVQHITSFLNNPKYILRNEIYDQVNILRKNTIVKKSGKSVLLTGETGVGKSKLLNQIVFEAKLSLDKILKMYLDDNTSEDFFVGKLLYKKVYNLYRNDIDIDADYKKIENELNTIIEKEQDYSYIFDPIIDFIFKCSSSGVLRLTLLLDNYERYDTESIRFVNRLSNINKNSGNVFLVISIATDKMNDVVSQSYKLMQYDPDIQKVDIPSLSYKETSEAINILLGKIGSLPSDFTKKLYDHSGGNFRKLMMYFDEFFQKGVLAYVSGLLLFRSKDKFDQILDSKIGRSAKSIIDGLDEKETGILKLLCSTFNKLTFSEIQQCVSVSDYDLNRVLTSLVNSELISGYEERFKAIKSDVKDYVFNKTSKSEHTEIYRLISNLDHKDKFSKYARILLKIVITEKISDLNMIDAYIDKLIKSDSNDNLFYLLLNSIKMTKEPKLRFRLRVGYARYLMKKDKKKAVKIAKNLDLIYRKKDRDATNRICFIKLKMEMHDPVLYNYDAYKFILRSMEFLEQSLDISTLSKLITDFIEKLLQTGEHYDQGVKIIGLLEKKFAREKNISFEYPNLLNVIKIVNGVIEWKDEYEKLLSSYISEHIKAQRYNDTYFYYLKTIGYLVEKDLLKNDYSERLSYGLEVAYRNKDADKMFTMFTTLSTYYYYKGEFEKSLYWDQKKVDLKQKLRKELTGEDIGDIATVKANLYYPVGEVISLIQETRRQAKEKNDLSEYIMHLTNEFILQHRKGDFRTAKTTIRKAFLIFRAIPENSILRHYERVSKYFPEIFSRDQALRDLNNLRTDAVSEEVYLKMKGYLDKYYEFNICYRWAPDRVDEVLSGELSLETPMMLLHYLKQNKKMPNIKNVMERVENRYNNPECTGDYLVQLVTKFMLSKDPVLVDTIFEYSRKLHISGYVMINVYTIIPFMEFALMVKVRKEKLAKFISFYEEIKNYLYNNMDTFQLKLFESTYFFRRGKKILEYYERI